MKALFAGSFDPITLGHLNIIQKAAPLFETLYVVILTNSEKKSSFPLNKRLEWIEKSIRQAGIENVECAVYQGLTVEACRKAGAKVLVRGLRNTQDFLYEQNIARINQYLAPDIESVFLLCDEGLQWISSSNVRELLKYNQDIKGLVPMAVYQDLLEERI